VFFSAEKYLRQKVRSTAAKMIPTDYKYLKQILAE